MCPTHVQIGKTTHMSKLLAFVDIFVESPEMDNVLESLRKLENLEELYEVTGEFDLVTLVSASDIEEFRDVLKNRIMKIKGIKSTVSSIVLKAHKGPKCQEEIKSPSTT
jgi:DNA-binding Lrp family transcriptional regulator